MNEIILRQKQLEDPESNRKIHPCNFCPLPSAQQNSPFLSCAGNVCMWSLLLDHLVGSHSLLFCVYFSCGMQNGSCRSELSQSSHLYLVRHSRSRSCPWLIWNSYSLLSCGCVLDDALQERAVCLHALLKDDTLMSSTPANRTKVCGCVSGFSRESLAITVSAGPC